MNVETLSSSDVLQVPPPPRPIPVKEWSSTFRVITRYVPSKKEWKDPEDTKSNLQYDVLYEHQRGAYLLGRPKFSSKSLGPLDPPAWTDKHLRYSPMDIHTYQLPDPTWEWVHAEWLVDMTGDVDEDGWEYCFSFNSGAPWHGHYQFLRSFVRRRRWLRLRCRKSDPEPEASDGPRSVEVAAYLQRIIENPDLFEQIKKKRLDREKLAVTKQFLSENGEDKVLDEFEGRLPDFVKLFDHQESKRKFLELLLPSHPTQTPVILSSSETSPDVPLENSAAGYLDFFSDVSRLLEQLKEANIIDEKNIFSFDKIRKKEKKKEKDTEK